MKTISKMVCPLCGEKNAVIFSAMPGYSLVRCNNCSMVWDFGFKENPLELYQKNYFINENPKGGYANYFAGMRVNKKTFHLRLKRIEKKLGKKGSLLDVGCALGGCLSEAKKMGWEDSFGLEISDYAFNFAGQRGLNVKKAALKESGFTNESFDIVTYQDVIEHISDPVSETREVHRILKKRGWVFFVTPDIDGIWRKLLGRFWYHYKPKEHITYFSQKTLKTLLQKTGFKNIETRKTYHVLSVEYILNRLRCYFPSFFGLLLKLARNTFLKNLSFKLYIGEVEAWGQKI